MTTEGYPPISRTSTHRLTRPDTARVDVSVTERGSGHPVVLLHGGAGPQSVTPFADLLAATEHVRVFTPTHPGFGGTPRPDDLASVRALAAAYSLLLDELQLTDVTLVGNSIGGWIAAETALLSPHRLSSLVIVDAVGIEVPSHPVVDFFGLSLDEVFDHSYYNPAAFRIHLSALPPAAQAVMAGNRAALAVYGGQSMVDPTLAGRLAGIRVPTLVLWGEADRIADADYGRAFAAAIPGAEFRLLEKTGHVPQIESPHQLLSALWEFADRHATTGPVR